MLQITIPAGEAYDERKNEFIYLTQDTTILLEHSLISVSKWEAKFKKPFLDDKQQKTEEELLEYIKFMTVTSKVDPVVYHFLTKKNIDDIVKYIEDPMTATWFSDKGKKPNKKEVLTSEVIYYLMCANQIPFECEKWHLNRLMTLLRVCGEKNAPPKKMSKSEIFARNRALNAQRRAMLGTKG